MNRYESCYIHAANGYLSHVGLNLVRGLSACGMRVSCNLSETDQLGSFSATYAGVAPSFEFEQFPEAVDFCIVDVTQGIGDTADLLRYIRGRKVAALNMADGANYSNALYAKSLLTFSTHCNKFATHGGAIYPLGCGVSDEAIAITGNLDLENKVLRFVKNFQPTFRQEVRASLELTLVENLAKFFPVDTRHTFGQEYWEHLGASAAVLAYCGEYYADVRRFAWMRDHVINGKPEYDFAQFNRDVVVFRWDSYRFWEAALSACAPLQLDFEKYGMQLPFMPIPWFHYVPIDLSQVNQLPDRIAMLIREDPQALKKIGQNARRWVIEHYSPMAVASYVLGVVQREWNP